MKDQLYKNKETKKLVRVVCNAVCKERAIETVVFKEMRWERSTHRGNRKNNFLSDLGTERRSLRSKQTSYVQSLDLFTQTHKKATQKDIDTFCVVMNNKF